MAKTSHRLAQQQQFRLYARLQEMKEQLENGVYSLRGLAAKLTAELGFKIGHHNLSTLVRSSGMTAHWKIVRTISRPISAAEPSANPKFHEQIAALEARVKFLEDSLGVSHPTTAPPQSPAPTVERNGADHVASAEDQTASSLF
jgi:hypothetical protein